MLDELKPGQELLGTNYVSSLISVVKNCITMQRSGECCSIAKNVIVEEITTEGKGGLN